MKANELMIGDWVFCTYPSINKPVRVAEIRTVSDNELKIVVYDDGIRLVLNETYMDPIPLTPEILEKNGWRSRMNGTGEFYLEKPLVNAAIVTKNIIGFQMNHGPFNGLSIHYVHNLQHVLRTCGIEKEIEL